MLLGFMLIYAALTLCSIIPTFSKGTIIRSLLRHPLKKGVGNRGRKRKEKLLIKSCPLLSKDQKKKKNKKQNKELSFSLSHPTNNVALIFQRVSPLTSPFPNICRKRKPFSFLKSVYYYGKIAKTEQKFSMVVPLV